MTDIKKYIILSFALCFGSPDIAINLSWSQHNTHNALYVMYIDGNYTK